MNTVIKIEGLSKAYQLGQFSTGTLSMDIQRWLAISLGKEDPYLKIGEANDRTQVSTSKMVWSLKDISLDITKGDAIGIIGRNGAGKSTLLKILSRVTSPTQGSIKLKGRVASLLEVGTGFHPELTGRENVFLNGAILGMRKREVKRKFDEIVAFAGVERYIDTPVKRYSSGMYVRLAFAVAAHLESEILIVDEVLAVGDAEFQKKCLGKMGDIGKSGERTILFVSHNMASIRSLCKSAMYLKNGTLEYVGETNEVISRYLESNTDAVSSTGFIPEGFSLHGTGEARFRSLNVSGKDDLFKNEFSFREQLTLHINLHVLRKLEQVIVSVFLVNSYGEKIAMSVNDGNFSPMSLEEGPYELKVLIAENILPGDYSFGLLITHFHSGADIDYVESFMKIKILKEALDKHMDYPWSSSHGYFQAHSKWEIFKKQEYEIGKR